MGPARIWADTGAHPVSLGAARMLLGGLVLTPLEADDLYRNLRAEASPRRVPPLWRLADVRGT
ncbi:hypothetical protein [Streptomyces sp. NPDC055632]